MSCFIRDVFVFVDLLYFELHYHYGMVVGIANVNIGKA